MVLELIDGVTLRDWLCAQRGGGEEDEGILDEDEGGWWGEGETYKLIPTVVDTCIVPHPLSSQTPRVLPIPSSTLPHPTITYTPHNGSPITPSALSADGVRDGIDGGRMASVRGRAGTDGPSRDGPRARRRRQLGRERPELHVLA